VKKFVIFLKYNCKDLEFYKWTSFDKKKDAIDFAERAMREIDNYRKHYFSNYRVVYCNPDIHTLYSVNF